MACGQKSSGRSGSLPHNCSMIRPLCSRRRRSRRWRS
jgi:hypothetical protein